MRKEMKNAKQEYIVMKKYANNMKCNIIISTYKKYKLKTKSNSVKPLKSVKI